MLAVDLETQLPDDLLMLTDKMSMATSLECRVPLWTTSSWSSPPACRRRSKFAAGASSMR